MAHKIVDINKIDSALTPASLDGAGVGQFFPLSIHRKALFAATLGVMAAGVTAIFQVKQAVDAAGTSSKDVDGRTVTVTANTQVSIAQLAIVTAVGGVHVAGQTVTINGLVFTAAAADVPTTREYAVGTTGADSAAALLAKINSTDENIGLPNVLGTASVVSTDSIITLTADEPGCVAITAAASAATTIVSTVEAVAILEVDASELDTNNQFSHVAISATTSAATLTSVALVRDNSRFGVDQTAPVIS